VITYYSTYPIANPLVRVIAVTFIKRVVPAGIVVTRFSSPVQSATVKLDITLSKTK
jgi:hypothetical protein